MTSEVEVDNLDSSLDMGSPIGPIFPNILDTYYDTAIRGCLRKCACRLWPNCRYYNNSRWNELKGDKEVLWEEIHDWYDNFFKYRPDMPDSNMNA